VMPPTTPMRYGAWRPPAGAERISADMGGQETHLTGLLRVPEFCKPVLLRIVGFTAAVSVGSRPSETWL
jgi:hypothetical protein